MLRLSEEAYLQMVGHAYDGYPLEACGLFAGAESGRTGRVDVFYATDNEAASAKVYSIPAKAFLHADRDADDHGIQLLGVMHSHTHTSSYPSPTDVRDAEASDPFGMWHFVIVSLKFPEPALCSFRILDGVVTEEPVRVLVAD